ncbi:MAG TPA: PHP domain-containing protein [Verrucomicrobiae bacterium]|nr:PHP domain-containing protein [Verrucomicrobiae bacterium]
MSKKADAVGLGLPSKAKKGVNKSPGKAGEFPTGYFRLRDYEYAQPLYDLAFFLEADATSKNEEIPKYRTFSLWRAAYGFDGYSVSLDRWLDHEINDDSLDYVPSARIQNYLLNVRESGSIPELKESFSSAAFDRLRRLRAVRGLGLAQVAETLNFSDTPPEQWLNAATLSTGLSKTMILEIYQGAPSRWQAAHVVPPLVRLLHGFDLNGYRICAIDGIRDGVSPIEDGFVVVATGTLDRQRVEAVLSSQSLFRVKHYHVDSFMIQHYLGWHFELKFRADETGFSLQSWAFEMDPLLQTKTTLKGDLHLHTAWSDGNASLESMASAAKLNGSKYIAVTDHSRSCKLQGGLTPVMWIRQAAAIRINSPECPVLHGIEVDILQDGSLDLPNGLLAGMDIVVASVHSNWADDKQVNTDRLITAIESGFVDIIGHPTSSVLGKPGVPNYFRPSATVDWKRIYAHCSKWRVALELNCFPSRLDLSVGMLREAIEAGCWISLGSDAHSRSHLRHLKFGEHMLRSLPTDNVLNFLDFHVLKEWLSSARVVRASIPKSAPQQIQQDLFFKPQDSSPCTKIRIELNAPQQVPRGSRIVGFDLTAGKGKPTGVALLSEMNVQTCSLVSDQDLLNYITTHKPTLVSIDSPLGFPGGGSEIDVSAGIVRVAEHDLSSVGIPAYPALIDSMKELTLRGVRLRKMIGELANPPVVIESYPGAAQDVLSIPRKQKSLELLRNGLRELGLSGPGLLTKSHDEMDAITAAVVGRFFESGIYLPMGIAAEAQLIVPKIRPLAFEPRPIICLAGRTGAGKSVVARYLALFFGFHWIRTRDIVKAILIDDTKTTSRQRVYDKIITADEITEQDVRDFGALILEKYNQGPIRARLSKTVHDLTEPLVIDSIRDLTDLDFDNIERPIYLWFVECPDSVASQRIAEKARLPSFKGRLTNYRIDGKIKLLRERCDWVLSNLTTLEDLRWKIDDKLFEISDLR